MTTPGEIRNLMKQAEKHFPDLEFDVILKFERVGQGTFEEKYIGAVSDVNSGTLTVNIDWYESPETPEVDYGYIIWHEMRHMYQRSQVLRLANKAPIRADEKTIRRWDYEFHHYIPNTPTTEYKHMKQDIEIDAYAFALYMVYRYSANPDGSVDIGLPPMIADELIDRVQKRFSIESITGKIFIG